MRIHCWAFDEADEGSGAAGTDLERSEAEVTRSRRASRALYSSQSRFPDPSCLTYCDSVAEASTSAEQIGLQARRLVGCDLDVTPDEPSLVHAVPGWDIR